MSGYSLKPLSHKLGIQSGDTICLLHAPDGYIALLEPLPADAHIHHELVANANVIQYFATQKETLIHLFPALKKALKKSGMLWVSWPKQTAGMNTDLKESIVQRIGLENGLVDVKVAAIDNTWSGLKFVYRTEDR